MLPRSLTVQNFLSYGAAPQTLSFAEFDLACLIGPNGVGKSSLIEALTWGIWGQARSGSDNDLVHQGAKAMSVTVDVEVGNQLCRIIRKRSVRGRGGTSLLEFQLQDGKDFRAITTPTIRDTQALIDRTLGLSYDTFVNSAYLRQGRADEFTTKRPAERKAILGEILGLSTYAELEERARQKLSLLEEQVNTQGIFLEQLQEELPQLLVLEATLAERDALVVQARAALELVEQQLAEWREKERQFSLRQQQVASAKQEGEALSADLGVLARELDDLQKRLVGLEGLIGDRERIEREVEEARKAQLSLEHWNAKLEQVHGLDEQRLRVERELGEARSERQAELQKAEAEVAVLESSVAQVDELSQRVKLGTGVALRLEETRAQRATLEESRLTLVGSSEQAKAEMVATKEQADTLTARKKGLAKAGAACPLCDQALTAAHRRKVEAEIEAEIEALRGAYKAAASRAKQGEKELHVTDDALAALGQEEAALVAQQGELLALERQLAEATARTGELARRRSVLEQLRAAPIPEATQQLQLELSTLEKKRKMLKYAREEHDAIRTLAEQTAEAFELAKQLATAAAQLEAAQAQRTALLERQSLKQLRLAELQHLQEEAVRSLEGAKIAAESVLQKAAEVEAARVELRARERAATEARGQVEHLRMKAQRAEEIRTQTREIDQRRSLLEELRQAFSRNGIPAMLIESAVPEIEDRANEILGRMTDHQMSVRLDLERQKKSGVGTIETLDIRIADSAGTRDYELYSGGEAFRINFALRIALSHLLARKAGTELRLLILDEGFGSQDTAGRETLVTVLNAVRQDFEKVLVVTHIQDLRDAFSYQIRIEKTPEGSVLVRE